MHVLPLVMHAGYAPRWVYLFAGWAVVFYTWLDCFDGKQARRTGTSSPLGQLFDHGCDALSVNLLLANIGASLGLSCGWAHGIGMTAVRHQQHCSSDTRRRLHKAVAVACDQCAQAVWYRVCAQLCCWFRSCQCCVRC
jgi:hypothetical protein